MNARKTGHVLIGAGLVFLMNNPIICMSLLDQSVVNFLIGGKVAYKQDEYQLNEKGFIAVGSDFSNSDRQAFYEKVSEGDELELMSATGRPIRVKISNIQEVKNGDTDVHRINYDLIKVAKTIL